MSRTKIKLTEIEEKRKKEFAEWLPHQIIPPGIKNAGHPYGDGSIEAYVSGIGSMKVIVDGAEHSAYYLIDPDEIDKLEDADGDSKANKTGKHRKSCAASLYKEFLHERYNTIISPEETARLLDDDTLVVEAEKNNNVVPLKNERNVIEYVRNAYVREFALRKADGTCQLCGEEAPFEDNNGRPFLEVHHIIWLASNGTDSIDNTIALCPNCHRKMHILNDPDDISFLKGIAESYA